MSNYESQHEIDDELLSAYLDDELLAEERAAVEARLADDPAAREMLLQLRTVSQAVQGLPQEIVGHDLCSLVLERVAQNDTPELGGAVPKLTIGRTRRGWLWASLAVAAALLVMAFQSDREANDNLPPVALRDEALVQEEVRRSATERGELEIRPFAEQAAAPAPSDVVADDLLGPGVPRDAVSSRHLDEVDNSPAREIATQSSEVRASGLATPLAAAPAAARGGAVSEQAANFDVSASAAMSPQSPSSTSASGLADKSSVDTLAATPFGGEGSDRSKELTIVPAEEAKTVVVRVLARREALESKAFDQLLAKNGIAMDAESANESSKPRVRARSEPQLAQQSEAETLLESAAPQPPASENQDQLVLVDAPAPAIESSLATLKADEVNYLGIAVDESSTSESGRRMERKRESDFVPTEQDSIADQAGVEVDWSKYNRGIVPPLSGSLARDAYFYQRDVEALDGNGVAQGFAGGYGREAGSQAIRQPEQLQQERLPLDRKNLEEQSIGRALRLRSWAITDGNEAQQLARRRYVAPGQTPPVALQLNEQSHQMAEQEGRAADRVQVLFVISPADVPASSPPARNKAQ